MIKNVKPPPRSLVVSKVGFDEWAFSFPRLDASAYTQLDEAVDDIGEGNFRKAEIDLREVIEILPEFIDAYNHLAIVLGATGREIEASELWRMVVEFGMEAVLEDYSRERDRLPWSILDNRPFLRACHGYGLSAMKFNKNEEALKIFEDLLSMDPDDNICVRGLAIMCGFELKRPDLVKSICDRFSNDVTEEILYGLPLALFQLDRKWQSREAMEKAIEIQPAVGKELAKKAHRMPIGYDESEIVIGSDTQGYYYWKHHGKFWKATPGALDFLRNVTRKTGGI